MGVLQGIRILEIAGIGPGPFCGMLLADLGAEVIMIERPAASKARPRAAQIFNRGKRSIVLDLKAPGALDIVLRLLEGADALIEGMRPGVMERIGLGPDVCLERRPSLVYGRMTGWGQYGPMAQAAGHDSNYLSLSGALWFSSAPGQPPTSPPTMLGDVGGGALYLALGVVSGVLRARLDNRGQVVDAAIVDGSAHMMNLLLSMVAGHGYTQQFERGISPSDASHWAARSYRCADERWINLAPLEPQFYALLLEKLGLNTDPLFVEGQMDPKAWPILSEQMAELFASRPRQHWCELLESTDTCFAPVLDPSEAAVHPHMAARQVYVTVDGMLQAAPAPRFSATPSPSPSSVPARGAHTQEVLTQAGFSPEEIERFRRSRVLGTSTTA